MLDFMKILLMIVPLLRAQASEAADTPNNCSYTYTLRTGSLSTTSSISVQATAGGESTLYSSLYEFLTSLNVIIPADGCLQLSLEPGQYAISTAHSTILSYSLTVSAPRGGVTLHCEDDPVSNTSHAPLKMSRTSGVMFVLLDGVVFEDCSRPLQFDNLDRVSITNCVFSDFTASAVDLFNIETISVHQSTFTNCSTNISNEQYRGNSGALSIAHYTAAAPPMNSTKTHPTVHISDCAFINNQAILPENNSSEQINFALNMNIYFGRGGALGLFVVESYFNIVAEVENCTFLENYADSFGGGMYIYIDGSETHHNFSVRGCNFTRNIAGEGSFGGGIQVAMLIRNFGQPSSLDFSGCHFEGNVADFGGGLSTVQVYSQGAGNNVSVVDSTFLRNRAEVGSALMFGSFLYVQNRNESYLYFTRNNVFSENSSPGGTFVAGFVNVRFLDTSTFSNNIGPGLRVVGSQVEVHGNLYFVGNNAENHDGGALFIQAFGQMKLYRNAAMEFVNNTGRIGSAIVVNVQRSSAVFSELVFNPQCFLVHEDSQRPPRDWNDVSIRFSGNRASVGPAIYISHLAHCSWYSAQPTSNVTNEIDARFSIQDFASWPLFKFVTDSNMASTQLANPSAQQYSIQTEPERIMSANDTNVPLKIRPGQTIRVNLIGSDQFNNPTQLIARLSDSRSGINLGAFRQAAGGGIELNNSNTEDLLQFEPALIPVLPSDLLVNVSYGFRNLDPSQFREGTIGKILLDTPYNVRAATSSVLHVELSNCQPGYVLQRRSVGDNLVVCECVTTTYDVLNCEEDVIVLQDGVWAGSEDGPLPHLDFYPCPTSYCRCFSRDGQTCETLYFQDDPARQCHPNREGVLCGSCVNGTGVGVLRSVCRECRTQSYYAIGFLVIGDILVIGFILFAALKLHLVFPHSFKGLLFYIQTVYYVTEYFPISFFDIRKYMLYLASLLGLYFPWDFCLYRGMTALVSFAPRFIPIVIATIMGTAAVVITYSAIHISKYTKKNISVKDGRKNVWHAVYSLILLLYAPLVHTCASLLHCPETPGDQQEEEAHRWFIDGEVTCFHDAGQIVLAIISILFLLVLSLLVPVMFIFTIVVSSKKVQDISRRVTWMYEVLTNGYRDSHETRWWAAWDLLRRLLLVILVVALPGRTLAPVFILIVAFSLHVFLHPYKKLWQNIFEGIILLNYIILFLLRGTQSFLDNLSNYSGTQVPADRGADLADLDSVTWLFFSFYYAPLLLALVFYIGLVLYWIMNWIRSKRHKEDYRIGGDRYERRVSSFAIINSDYADFEQTLPAASTMHPNVTFTEVSL